MLARHGRMRVRAARGRGALRRRPAMHDRRSLHRRRVHRRAAALLRRRRPLHERRLPRRRRLRLPAAPRLPRRALRVRAAGNRLRVPRAAAVRHGGPPGARRVDAADGSRPDEHQGGGARPQEGAPARARRPAARHPLAERRPDRVPLRAGDRQRDELPPRPHLEAARRSALGSRGMRELNPFSYAFHEDPYPTYRWLRDEHPVYRNERLGFWALSRYHDVVEASRDWAVYSSAEGTTLERLDPRLGDYLPMMIFMDPPRQTRLRSLVSKVFTPRRVAALEPFVRERARHHLDRLAAAAGGDFVRECSALLPMDVIFTLLGVPAGDRDRMRGLMDASLHRDPDTPAIPPAAVDAMAQQGRYWFELVAARRRRPEDDLVSQLIAAELPGDDGTFERLTDAEVAGFLNLLGAAGNETVTKLLANAIV